MAGAMGIGRVVLWLAIAAWPAAAGAAQSVDPEARALVVRAAARMGGEAALRAVARVRFEMMTVWQRTEFRGGPGLDQPSYEQHTDVRDYTIPAWRNTREFGNGRIVNVVRDTVAITDPGRGFQPLSVAYVDERDELFAYTPDRLVLAALDAPVLRAAPDTVLDGERHETVAATLPGGLGATISFHPGTGLPRLMRFRRAHPNDFGLVPWGVMDVEVWYSAWRTFGPVHLATQWDIRRVGRPYKRMTVRQAAINPAFAADSFTVPDSLRRAFLATRRPMHDRAIDSVTAAAPGLLAIHGFGFPAGALAVGRGWLLLEAGSAALSLGRGRQALAGAGAARVDGALVAAARTGNGGVAELVREGVPVWTSAAAEPFVRAILANHGIAPGAVRVVRTGTWLELGGDSVRLEPIDLPDVHGSLLLWAPRLQWLWVPDAALPLDVTFALERARALGWAVRSVGTARALRTPVAAPGAAGGRG